MVVVPLDIMIEGIRALCPLSSELENTAYLFATLESRDAVERRYV